MFMTRKGLLNDGQRILMENGIAGAGVDAWLLFQHVTGISRVTYLMAPEAEVSVEDEEKYRRCIQKRSERYPLQYMTHSQSFMGLEFYVDEHVLVPRQDTETLVETVLGYIKDGMDVLDMCTGSGCILISLAANVSPGRGIGADLSGEALAVAEMNAKLNDSKAVSFIQSDIYEGIDSQFGDARFDVIVSNPPYIASDEIETLMPEVSIHEPRMALDGHADGLYFYRKIISGAKAHLKENGMIFFEIGCDQAESVSRLLRESGFSGIRVKKDLSGLDRVVFAVNNEV